MKNVISLLSVGDDDVGIFVLVQRVDHGQLHAFEFEFIASIHPILQPGAFVLFPLGRYVEIRLGGCVFQNQERTLSPFGSYNGRNDALAG
jgi:hypothetical protein